ncbi:MAG: hypothetical protein HeimC3_41750 [Candidatus Heimdallarchaeota archaeon LC_3]|nr:MAG: hypothetical protein HeimC3_41750 [Candidatus Heimdallarchaeota archaeon LC_3]
MTKIYPPVRKYIQQTLKDFPWSYFEQGRAFAAISDHLVAGRKKSLSAYTRTGIEEITVRKFSHALLTGEYPIEMLKEDYSRENNTIDRRETFNISVDDTSAERHGKKVFGGAIQFDHSKKGYEYGNVFVDYSVIAPSYYDCGYQIYLAKSWLEKELIPEYYLQTKIELANQIFEEQIKHLSAMGVDPKRIKCTSDSWFGCKKICDAIRAMGAFFTMGMKKMNSASFLERDFSRKGIWIRSIVVLCYQSLF